MFMKDRLSLSESFVSDKPSIMTRRNPAIRERYTDLKEYQRRVPGVIQDKETELEKYEEGVKMESAQLGS